MSGIRDGGYPDDKAYPAERPAHNFSATTEKLAEIGGYLGIGFVQGATLPTSIGVIMGWTDHLPPLSMVLLVWIGLILFFIRALVRFDWLYLVSNGIGLIANSILLIIIVYR